MKKIVIMMLLLACSLTVWGRPAFPGVRTVRQPDGTSLQVLVHGDEWGHWMTDTQGRVVARAEDGFYRVLEGVTLEMASQAASARRKARMQLRSQAAKLPGHVAVGQKHFLVILVEFSDIHFSTPGVNAAVTALLNDENYSGSGATGSARDFYYQNSHGYFEPIFDVYGPVTLTHPESYYGGNDSNGDDKNPEQAIVDGCKGLDDQINFANYDLDEDGKVDMVFMLYAGYGEADYDGDGAEDTIWPHMYYLSQLNKAFTLDGKTIDKYACANELAGYGQLEGQLDGIGAVCHEFGHAMGLPDFYDTDQTNGTSGALYDFSTMDAGNYNNDSRTPPFFNMEERILLGWEDEATAYREFTANGSMTIPLYDPREGSPVAYKTPTDENGEYYVYECRGNGSWDQYLSGHGLLVYHVDKSANHTITVRGSTNVKASLLWSNWEAYNAINNNGNHPCFYTVVSSDQNNYNYAPTYVSGRGYMYRDDGDKVVFPGTNTVTSFTPTSWSGAASPISFSQITYPNGEGSVSLSVSGVPGMDYPVIANPGNGVYAAGGSFNLAIDYSGATQGVSWTLDGNAVAGPSVTLEAGAHLIEATVTLDGGKTAVVSLEVTAQ